MTAVISFVIPAYNEQKNIRRCVTSILKNIRPAGYSFEIIVANHGSTDGTADEISDLEVIVVDVPKGGTVAKVRNAGVARSSGDVLIFLDADTETSDSWSNNIRESIEQLLADRKMILGSHCVPPDSDNFLIENWFKHTTSKSSGNYLGTAHLITTRLVFDLVDGFDESLSSGEDYDFCTKARNSGVVISINNNLKVVHHDYPRTAWEFVRREAWHGRGDLKTMAHFLASKVSLLAAMFVTLHITFLIGCLLLNMELVFGSFIGILVLCLSAAAAKFRHLPMIGVLKAASIFYLYLFGRSASFVNVASKSLGKSRKESSGV